MNTNLIEVTDIFVKFGQIIYNLFNLYPDFGDYNFNHYSQEMIEIIITNSIYNRLNQINEKEKFCENEYDINSDNISELGKIIFFTLNTQNNILNSGEINSLHSEILKVNNILTLKEIHFYSSNLGFTLSDLINNRIQVYASNANPNPSNTNQL